MRTVNNDVFYIEKHTLSKEIVELVMSNESQDIISAATFHYEQRNYFTYNRVYGEDGEILAERRVQNENILYFPKWLRALRKKYRTISWANIKGLINSLGEMVELIENKYEGGQYNIVWYTYLGDQLGLSSRGV